MHVYIEKLSLYIENLFVYIENLRFYIEHLLVYMENLCFYMENLHVYKKTCTNAEISRVRVDFFKQIKTEVEPFQSFTNRNIIDYCMTMNDPKIQIKTAKFVKDIMTTYKDETDGSIEIVKPSAITRSGRQTRMPIKLNL